MRRAPPEFADLLTPRGRRILEGRDRATAGALLEPSRRFLGIAGALDREKARALRDLIDRSLRDVVVEMADPIPEWTVRAMEQNYAELLPKTVRVRTALLESRRARSFRIAEQIGLVRLLRSETFAHFAQALAGRPLKKRFGIQTLCYGAGDYAGPHNDHHPEEADAKDGYLDMHLTLATDAVESQYLVYEEGGHFSAMQDVNTVGGITAYRLPFWHYTTPLMARPRRTGDARRWVLLGTFLFSGRRTS